MIVLTVLSYSGLPTPGLSANFDEIGGSIGRADNNQLVLPDPERSISRQHARVVFRGGHYAIVDNGNNNPIAVNGTPVSSGREQPLQPGDQVQIGSYLLSVSTGAPATAASTDPFADLFGDGAHGLASPQPPAAASAWTAPPMVAAPHRASAYAAVPPPTTPPAPPSAAWGAPAPSPAWAAPPPGAAWASPAPARAAPPAPAPGARATAAFADDWDFLAAPAAKPPPAVWNASATPGAGSVLGLSMGPGGLDSLDDLFGLGPAHGPSSHADPLGAAPAQALLLQPNMAAHADPLQALSQATPPPSAASQADHWSELNTPMSLPPSRAAASTAPTTADPPSGAIFSWDDPPRDSKVVTLPGQVRTPALADAAPAAPRPVAASTAAPGPAPVPTSAPPSACATPAAPAARSAGAAAAPGNSAHTHLLAALLQGLNTPALRIESLTPELMHLIGQILRESTRGTVELLLARAALKREMRAQLTMIVARENNPLKFSPSVEVALQHLLGAPSPGFMPAAPAMRDAFDDLRAHQLGVMAGMKAALDGVLQRFDPQHLEAKLSTRSALASLIPATRKARLWELFQQLFGQLSNEAHDDFDELFGKAFLLAYEAQLDRLQSEPGPR